MYDGWVGYEGTDEESSWIGASDMGHSSELVEVYHIKYPTRPGTVDQFRQLNPMSEP